MRWLWWWCNDCNLRHIWSCQSVTQYFPSWIWARVFFFLFFFSRFLWSGVCMCMWVYSSSCYKVTIRKALMLPFEKSTERPKEVDASHIYLHISNVWYGRMFVEREICRSLDAVVTLLFYLLHSNLLCLKPCCTDSSLPFHEIHHTFRIGRVCCKQRSQLDHSFPLLGPSQNWMKFRIWASHMITENSGWEFGARIFSDSFEPKHPDPKFHVIWRLAEWCARRIYNRYWCLWLQAPLSILSTEYVSDQITHICSMHRHPSHCRTGSQLRLQFHSIEIFSQPSFPRRCSWMSQFFICIFLAQTEPNRCEVVHIVTCTFNYTHTSDSVELWFFGFYDISDTEKHMPNTISHIRFWFFPFHLLCICISIQTTGSLAIPFCLFFSLLVLVSCQLCVCLVSPGFVTAFRVSPHSFAPFHFHISFLLHVFPSHSTPFNWGFCFLHFTSHCIALHCY